jgi:ABC-type bacteriocin/lantibiotic exporter with double-glycine peptidase domain
LFTVIVIVGVVAAAAAAAAASTTTIGIIIYIMGDVVVVVLVFVVLVVLIVLVISPACRHGAEIKLHDAVAANGSCRQQARALARFGRTAATATNATSTITAAAGGLQKRVCAAAGR